MWDRRARNICNSSGAAQGLMLGMNEARGRFMRRLVQYEVYHDRAWEGTSP